MIRSLVCCIVYLGFWARFAFGATLYLSYDRDDFPTEEFRLSLLQLDVQVTAGLVRVDPEQQSLSAEIESRSVQWAAYRTPQLAGEILEFAGLLPDSPWPPRFEMVDSMRDCFLRSDLTYEVDVSIATASVTCSWGLKEFSVARTSYRGEIGESSFVLNDFRRDELSAGFYFGPGFLRGFSSLRSESEHVSIRFRALPTEPAPIPEAASLPFFLVCVTLARRRL